MKVVEKEKENGGNGENGKEEKKGGGIFGGLFSKKKDVAVSYRHCLCLCFNYPPPTHPDFLTHFIYPKSFITYHVRRTRKRR